MGPDATPTKFTSELLNGSNWTVWAWEFKLGAQDVGVWEIIEGTEPQPTSPPDELAKWNKRHATAMHQLAKCINGDMKRKIMGKDKANDAWNALESHFRAKSGHERFRRRQELNSLKMRDFKSMSAFIDTVNEKARELKDIDGKCDDEDALYVILAGLTDQYDYAASYIRQDGMTLEQATSYLNSESAAKSQKLSSSPRKGSGRNPQTHERSAFVANDGKGRKHRRPSDRNRRIDNNECHRCGEKGHRAKDCRAPAPKLRELKKDSNVYAAFIGNANNDHDRKWFVDSGATHHMTGDETALSNASLKTSAHPPITIGNGAQLQVKSVADTKTGPVRLQGVLHIPGLAANLISVTKALDNGIDEVSFKRKTMKVEFCKDGQVIATGTRSGNLFALDNSTMVAVSTSSAPRDTFLNWHRRLGHICYEKIQKLAKDGVIIGTGAIPQKTEPCEACLQGGMSRKRRKQRPDPVKAERPGETFHSDVCGPMNKEGTNGARYFVTFIDDFSRHVSVFAIRQKSQVLSKFKDLISSIETEFEPRRTKTLISDNGGNTQAPNSPSSAARKALTTSQRVPTLQVRTE